MWLSAGLRPEAIENPYAQKCPVLVINERRGIEYNCRMPAHPPPARPIILGHPKLVESLNEAQTIAAYLAQKGFEAPHGSLYDEKLRKQVHAGKFDLLIAVGGDGTMLRAGHLCAPHNIPILGINKGRLGFLFQIDAGGWQKMIDQLLAGDYWLENRMMLRALHIRSGEMLGSWQALNDVVVGRGPHMRPIHVSASVDGQYLTKYVCDGLIASTPTRWLPAGRFYRPNCATSC